MGDLSCIAFELCSEMILAISIGIMGTAIVLVPLYVTLARKIDFGNL